jgi:hypothetical protein
MSDETLERELSLVQSLHKRTRAGKVNWEASTSPAYTGGFQAEFGNVIVVIREVHDPDYPEQPDYELLIIQPVRGAAMILNPPSPQEPLGRVVETISNLTLRPVIAHVTEEGLNPYTLLSETFLLARRKAFKVDEVLDGLLHELDRE